MHLAWCTGKLPGDATQVSISTFPSHKSACAWEKKVIDIRDCLLCLHVVCCDRCQENIYYVKVTNESARGRESVTV